MKRLFTIIASLMLTFSINAQELTTASVKVNQKGTLHRQLSADEWRNVSSLKLKGELDAEDFAFIRTLGLKSLDLSGISNKVLPVKALQGCLYLESVILPDGMGSLGIASFMHCTSLKNIQLPKKLIEIHSLAFSECSSLTDVYIPKNVTTINAGAFYACTSIKNFKVEGGNAKFKAIDGVLYSDSSLVVCPSGIESLIVDSSAIAIENAAFGGCEKLTSVLLPKQVRRIGDGAFWNCKSLKNVYLPDSLKVLGNGVFLGAGIKSLTWPSNLGKVPSETFKNCTSLTAISLPLGVDSIGNGAFQGCANLSEVVLPKTMTMIGSNTFHGCLALKNIELPSNLIFIGNEAFASSGLKSITIPNNVKGIENGTFAQCANLKDVNFPNSLLFVGSNAFQNCASLEKIILPKSVNSIGDAAFMNCNIRSVTLPTNLSIISKAAFKNCQNLGEIELPEKLVEVAEDAFSGCTALTEIVIPEGVVGIANGAFKDCKNLTSVTLPSTLLMIGSNSFADCANLLTISCSSQIPPKMSSTTFGVDAKRNAVVNVSDDLISAYKSNPSWRQFEHLTGSFVLNVTRPGLMSFMITDSMWTNLQNVKITGLLNQKDLIFLSNLLHRGAQIRVLDLRDVDGLEEFGLNLNVKKTNNIPNNHLNAVYAPLSSKVLLANAFAGFEKLEKVCLSKNVVKISDNAFVDCMSLSTFKLPESIKEIGSYCFVNCKKLNAIESASPEYISVDGVLYSKDKKVLIAYPANKKSEKFTIPNGVENLSKGAFAYALIDDVEFPSSLTSISDSAFANCSGLKQLSVPSNIQSIGNAAFIQDSSLSMVIVSEGVKNIGVSAFQNCVNLQSVDLSNSVEAIGDYAFWNCPNIENFVNRAEVAQNVKPSIVGRFSRNCGQLFVESAAMPSFRKSSGWSKFTSIESLSLGN